MSKGQGQHGLDAARAELIARDGALGDADRALTGVVSAAVAQAADAIRRIEAVQEITGNDSFTALAAKAAEMRKRMREDLGKE